MKSYQTTNALLQMLGQEPKDFTPTATNTTPLILEGELRLWCQEGGMASDAIQIGEQELDLIIKRHFGTSMKDKIGNTDVARIRLTIEVIG